MRKGARRSGLIGFVLKRFYPSRRAARGWRLPGASPLLLGFPPRLLARGGPRFDRDPGTACLGKADRDGLLGISCAVLPFANVVYLLANELTSRGRRRLALCQVTLGFLLGFGVRHVRRFASSLPPARPSAVRKLHAN